MADDSEKGQQARKALWASIRLSLFGKYSLYAANAISMMILARLISPDVFGVVALGAVCFAFSQLLAEAGIGSTIINLRQLSPAHRDGIFSFVIVTGGVAAAVLVSTAGLIAEFFGDPRLTVTIRMVALSMVFQSAASLPIALQLRERRFMRISTAGILGELVSTIATIVMLGFFDPIISLSAKMPIMAFFQFAVNWRWCAQSEFGRPKPGLQLSSILQIWHSSLAQFGFNSVNFFSRNLDSILVGKVIGMNALGFYDRSYQLMRYPLLLLSFALVPAIQPALRDCAGDEVEIEKLNCHLTTRLAMLGIGVGFIFWVGASLIVRVVLGPNWGETARLLQILSLSIPVQVVAATSGAFYQAMDRMGTLFLTGVITASINVAAMTIGVLSGSLDILSWWIVAAFTLSFLVNYVILYRWVLKQPIYRFATSAGAMALGFVAIMFGLDTLINRILE